MSSCIRGIVVVGTLGLLVSAANADVQISYWSDDFTEISPGYEHHSDAYNFTGNRLYGFKFTLTQDVAQGSGLSLIQDTFFSTGDTVGALYRWDGELLAINDDYDRGSDHNAYLGFGDAPPAPDPLIGETTDGDQNFQNVVNLTAGDYVFLIGPKSTIWDKLNMFNSIVDSSQQGKTWFCNVTFLPAPSSLAVAGFGACLVGGRRRRKA